MEKNQTQVLGDEAIQAFFNDDVSPIAETPQEEDTTSLESFFNTPQQEEEPEVKHTVEPTAQEDVKTSAPQVNKFYADLVKEYIQDGDWQDGTLELEDGTEILLSEIEDFTPELFKQIKVQQKELQEQKIKESYISVDGLDDTTKKMIELKKAGGDINQLIQQQTEIVNPLKDIDLDDEKQQEWLVTQKYLSMGWKPKHIQDEIAELKENLTLDLEAKKIADEVNASFDRQVEAQLKKQEEVNRLKEEENKKIRKTLTETFRGFNIQKDSLVASLVNAATKADENDLTEADKAFFELREKDPKHFAEVVFLLMNKEGYDTFKGTKIKNEATIKTANAIFKIHPKSSSAQQQPDKKNAVEKFMEQ